MSAQKFPLAENYEKFVTLSENIAFTVVKENTFEEIQHQNDHITAM